MSCKSAIYTVNSGAQTVAVGGTIPLGSVIRRFGCNANLNGNGITIDEQGYYDVDVAVTLTPATAGTVTVTLMRDGVAVPGATASAFTPTADDPVSVSFHALVRQLGNCSGSTLTLMLTAPQTSTVVSASVTNAAVIVKKI